MNKENLFQLIRKEEVVLWAGAGLSMYAGYPSGNKLKEVLYNSLTHTEQKIIDKTLLLTDFSEEFCRIKNGNKNALIRLLTKAIENVNPSSIETHKTIAAIPHFRTIITTNYDRLFELAYGSKCQVILSDKTVPYIDKERIQIVKIHGDFSDADSIVITKSDYVKFFSDNKIQNPIWTIVRERIATKVVCFIGYNFEDYNIGTVFDQMDSHFGLHKRECFFIAPGLQEHKVYYLQRKGVHYIDMSAETFISELLINIKENIIRDFENRYVSSDVFHAFLVNNNLLPELRSDAKQFQLSAIRAINGRSAGNIALNFNGPSLLQEELFKIVRGEQFGKIDINSEEIKSGGLSIHGVTIVTAETVDKITIKSTPAFDSISDIVFNDGYEIKSNLTIYVSAKLVQVDVKIIGSVLQLMIDYEQLFNNENTLKKFQAIFKHSEICSSVSEEINLFKFLVRYSSGVPLRVYHEGAVRLSTVFPRVDGLLEEAEYYLKHFECLKLIETHKQLRFGNIPFSQINQEMVSLAEDIVNIINGEPIVQAMRNEFKATLDLSNSEALQRLSMAREEDCVIEIKTNQIETVELYGHSIELGFKKIEVLNGYFSAVHNNSSEPQDVVCKIISRSQKMRISYSHSNWKSSN